MAAITLVSSNEMFGGFQKVYSHESTECKWTMKFGVYIPPQAEVKKFPVLYWLSGQDLLTNAKAQSLAAEKGIILVAPDTNPQDVNIEGEDNSWALWSGPGFYVDATEGKWKTNHRMYSYVTKELPEVINANFSSLPDKMSIFGHSMGGHGALVCALRNPGKYQSVSAFAPVTNPIQEPWGPEAFTGYLGGDQSKWQEYDATELVKKYTGPDPNILVHQAKLGYQDHFVAGKRPPDNLEAACASNNVPINLRIDEGFDHSLYFIGIYIEEHMNHHAKFLYQGITM